MTQVKIIISFKNYKSNKFLECQTVKMFNNKMSKQTT